MESLRNGNRQHMYAWVVMPHLWAMDLVNNMVFFSIGVLIPIWKEDLGISPTQAGLLGSAGFLGFGLMALPASIWLTQSSPKRITLLCAAGMAALAIGQSVATATLVLMVSRMMFVMLAAARLQIQVIFIQQWFEPRLYATINSLDFGTRSFGQMIAIAFTPTLVILLNGWRNYYLVLGIGMAVVTASWIFLGKDRNRSQQEGGSPPQIGSPASVLLRHKELWIVAGAQMGAAVAFGSFMTFYPTYAIDRLGISLGTAGLLMGVFRVGATIGTLAAGPLSQMIGRRKPFIWVPGIVLPISYIFLLQVNSLSLSMLFLFTAGMGAMTVPPILATIPMDMRLPYREVAVAQGLIRTLFPFSAMWGPLFVGLMEERTGSLFIGLIFVAPLAITLFIAGILLPETGAKGVSVLDFPDPRS